MPREISSRRHRRKTTRLRDADEPLPSRKGTDDGIKSQRICDFVRSSCKLSGSSPGFQRLNELADELRYQDVAPAITRAENGEIAEESSAREIADGIDVRPRVEGFKSQEPALPRACELRKTIGIINVRLPQGTETVFDLHTMLSVRPNQRQVETSYTVRDSYGIDSTT